jgi:hypothetical protein
VGAARGSARRTEWGRCEEAVLGQRRRGGRREGGAWRQGGQRLREDGDSASRQEEREMWVRGGIFSSGAVGARGASGGSLEAFCGMKRFAG